ncbi:MAG: acyl-CoA dehydrogenase family protein [Deltaproteobacteria bacterium]|nr:acyl-CoA dehydrogenase family protein [Deltaproteobacteria bacterium]
MTDAMFTLENPTEEHALLRRTVRDFAQSEIDPQADAHDRSGELNKALLRRCGELGLLGVTVPAEWGGGGLDVLGSVLVHHEIAKSDPGFGLAYLAHAVLFVNNFFYAANDEQRRRYLDKTLTGEHVACMCMTEPDYGTDGMQTSARRDGDHYVLSGRKALITNAPDAHLFLVYAKVGGRISAFVAERGMPGLSTPPRTHKMGMRASTLGEVVLDDCIVPRENLLGEEGGGVVHMMRNLEAERLTLAALSLGIADRCLDVMIRYAAERKAFGKPIAEFGQIQRYVADSFAKTEAARTLIYTVARDVSATERNRIGTDAAKLFAAPVGKEVADNAMQVLGGWGYCDEYKVERFLRDAKLLEIGGGTIEAHQKNLTRDLVKRLGA